MNPPRMAAAENGNVEAGQSDSVVALQNGLQNGHPSPNGKVSLQDALYSMLLAC